ncbi:MAG: hypothetical protein IPM82_13660 [Saprospiraceae bacterium]|nr:hypothetical protein [Saprospiraceae bacterium]
MTPCTQEESTTFLEKIQNTPGLDLRDERGKRHCIAVILLELLCCATGMASYPASIGTW